MRAWLLLFLAIGFLNACSRNTNSVNQHAYGADVGIIGGQLIDPNDPLARSVIGLVNVRTSEICTGVLVTPEHVLTAAHCLSGSYGDYRIEFGSELSRRPKSFRMIEKARLCERFLFENQPSVDLCDIAIMKMNSQAPEGYEPAELEVDREPTQVGSDVSLLGYGLDNPWEETGSGQLRRVQTTILDPNYGKFEFRIDQSQGRGGCHGDSGAPLFVVDEGRDKLIGIQSRNQFDKRSKCQVAIEATYVPNFMQWISDSISQL